MKYAISVVYVGSILTANLTVNRFGPEVIPLVSFFLIGLDLTSRDYLHERFSGTPETKIFGLIALGGVGAYLVNSGAEWVAIASVSAFVASGIVDTGVYSYFSDRTYPQKANLSNLAGSIADSALFCSLAFGAFPWAWFALQCFTKFAGGAVWVWVFDRSVRYFAVPLLAFAFLLPGEANAQNVYLSSHFDIRRQQPIVAVVHETPLPGPFFGNGYVEAWRNPSNGVPASEWTLFSKHWITYPVSDRLSVSLGLAFIYNRPGVNFQWPRQTTFFEDGRGPYFTPKIGLQYRICC